jgi:hypothetical protein
VVLICFGPTCRAIACLLLLRFNKRMPELTRRRNLEAPDECWHIYFGDVRVGMIGVRTSIPPWGTARQITVKSSA